MSIPNGTQNEAKVGALLLGVLSEEDANVVAAEEEVTKCLAAVDRHKQRRLMLREALRALGVDPDNTQLAVGSVPNNE